MSLPTTVCAFTIDVEGFAESHAQSVHMSQEYLLTDSMDREIEQNLDVTLTHLSRFNISATFFFLGRIAQTAPKLVRRVAAAGHEIGCHSLNHVRITGQSRGEFRNDLYKAKSALEDASGTEVVGFRAPDFSIGTGNLWAFDELRDAGFRYDSSVVPTSIHDVYGMTNVPETIFTWPNGLVEFPMPVAHVFGLRIPLGGGGYFRLFPASWSSRFFASRQRRQMPATFYIHPYELGPIAPRVPGLSFLRRFRHYVRLHEGVKRSTHMLKTTRFTTMFQVLRDCGHLSPRIGQTSR